MWKWTHWLGKCRHNGPVLLLHLISHLLLISYIHSSSTVKGFVHMHVLLPKCILKKLRIWKILLNLPPLLVIVYLGRFGLWSSWDDNLLPAQLCSHLPTQPAATREAGTLGGLIVCHWFKSSFLIHELNIYWLQISNISQYACNMDFSPSHFTAWKFLLIEDWHLTMPQLLHPQIWVCVLFFRCSQLLNV